MYLTQEFEIPAGIDEAWTALLDIQDVVKCMPGASLTGSIDERTWTGTMDFRLGAIHLVFQGQVRLDKQDADTRTILMWAEGSEARGKGTGKGTITSTLQEAGTGTKASVSVYLQLSGQVAQFGRGLIESETERLVGDFASCLAKRLSGEAATEPR